MSEVLWKVLGRLVLKTRPTGISQRGRDCILPNLPHVNLSRILDPIYKCQCLSISTT